MVRRFPVALFLLTIAVAFMPRSGTAQASAGEQSKTANEANDKQAAAPWRDFEFQVLTAKGEPVAGATVTPWQVAFRTGSMGVGPKLSVPRTTDDSGRFQFTIMEDDPLVARLIEVGGVRSVAFQIDHPNHPRWSDYVPVEEERTIEVVDPTGRPAQATAKIQGPRQITLANAATVIIRVQPDAAGKVAEDLFPAPPTLDWSAAHGIVTLRRVDLSGARAMRWLRIVQAPADGLARFSDLIDLKQHKEPITIDAELKPGVRVAGRLSNNVPRPVAGGRVITHIVVGDHAGGPGWWWSAAVPIAPDGTFVVAALPPDENLQLIARCEGWLSAPPTKPEVEAYGAAYSFATGPRDDTMMRVPSRAYPQLYRLTGESLDFEVPMEPTMTCEIKVVDQDDQPVKDARVVFSPNQYWFEGGSQLLGAETDSLANLRMEAEKRQRPGVMPGNPFFEKRTDDRGVATIANLPACGPGGPAVPRTFRFNLSRDGYELPPDAPLVGQAPFRSLNITIQPGKTAQATVRLQKKS